MPYMAGTVSWLWQAFSSSEHLSMVFKMSCQLIACHICKIQKVSKKMTGKVALNEKFAQSSSLCYKHNCSVFMPVTSTSPTRTCCHLVDCNWQNTFRPLTQQIPLDGVLRILNSYYFRCPTAHIFKVSRSSRPRKTVKLRRISSIAFSSMRNSRLQISKHNTETLHIDTSMST